jgi:hypothetical protein
MTFVKALLATLAATVGALVVALGPGSNSLGQLDTKTWLVAILTILGSGGLVAWVENVPSVAPIAKAVVGFLSAGIASLVVALNDGVITQSEWLVAFGAAVAAAAAVYQIKNKSA